jgi:xanthine dehydrogenase accessory factor
VPPQPEVAHTEAAGGQGRTIRRRTMQRQAATARKWRADGRRAAVARVVATEGLGPRASGDLLLVDDQGETVGHLLEGTVDGTSVDAARAVLADGAPAWQSVRASIAHDDATAAGLTCGGHATVLVQRLDLIPDGLWDALAAGRPVALVSALGDQPATLVVRQDTAPDGDLLTLDPAAAARAETAAQDLLSHPGVSSTRLESEGVPFVIDAWNPVPRLVILGVGPLADALDGLLGLLGWVAIPCASGAEAGALVAGLTTADGLLVVEHDHDMATPVLTDALRTGVGYVGALGSRRTQAERRRRLGETDLTAAQLARLHGPAGLDIGGTTPAETAVSIVAEMIAVRSGRPAAPLATTSGSISV